MSLVFSLGNPLLLHSKSNASPMLYIGAVLEQYWTCIGAAKEKVGI